MAPNKPTKEALLHAKRRGEILNALKASYPEPIDVVMLRHVMSNLGIALMPDELKAYLYYLEEAGYIKYIEDGNKELLCVALSNKGLNLIDGFIQDQTIILE